MLISALLLLGVLGILGIFGVLVARELGVTDWMAALAMGSAFGLATWLFLMNVLAYLLPVPAAITASILLIICADGILLFSGRNERLREHPPLKIAAVVFAIIALAGLAYARDPGSDAWAWTHFPLASTILQGNFPIHDPSVPWDILAYHYGPALLAAGMTHLTGATLAAAYAVQPVLNIAAIVLFAATIAWRMTRSWPAAAVSGALALGGAGLFWLHGFYLIGDLWNFYVLHEPIVPAGETPFRWLAHAVRILYASPPLMQMNHKPIGMGIAFLFGFLFCVIETLDRGDRHRHRALWSLAAVIFGAGVALTLETSLAATAAASTAFIVLLALGEMRNPIEKSRWLKVGAPLIAVIALTLIIAKMQGGVLSVLRNDVGAQSFAFGFDGRIHFDGGPMETRDTIALWEWRFFREYGIHMFLLLAALVYGWKNRREHPGLLFLCLIAGVHFAIPLFVRFLPREHEMNRLFFPAFGVSSLIIGIFLWETCFKNKKTWKRIAATVCIAAMLVASAAHIPVRLLFPTLRIERTSLFPSLPTASAEEHALYAWVKGRTTLNDIFFAPPTSKGDFPKRAVAFATHTGRFTTGASTFVPPSKEILPDFTAMVERCDSAAMKRLSVHYAVLLTQDDETWFKKTCTSKAWKAVYSEKALPQVLEFVQ